jgi:hypothetical protein
MRGLSNWTTVGQLDELKALLISKKTPPPLFKSEQSNTVPPEANVSLDSNIKKVKSYFTVIAVATFLVLIIIWLI